MLAWLSGSYVPIAETLCCFVCLLLHEARRIFFWGKCTFECLKQMIPDINDVRENWQEPRLLRPTGLGARLIFYEPATSSRRKFRTPDTKHKKLDTKTISDNLVLNRSFNTGGHLRWHELNELFAYPPLGGESMLLTRGTVVDPRLILQDTDLSVVSSQSTSVPKTPSEEGTGDVTQRTLSD